MMDPWARGPMDDGRRTQLGNEPEAARPGLRDDAWPRGGEGCDGREGSSANGECCSGSVEEEEWEQEQEWEWESEWDSHWSLRGDAAMMLAGPTKVGLARGAQGWRDK